MKFTVLFALLAAILWGPLPAVEKSLENQEMIYYQMENGRFYNCAPMNTSGDTRLVAVGQRSAGEKSSKRQGYVAVLIEKSGRLIVEAEDLFSVAYNDRKWPTRVRTVSIVNAPGGSDADIFITGRGGGDEQGIGFLRHYTWKNNTLTSGQTIIMHQKQEGIVYTHGYSLKSGDIDGDGKQEAIYGGFFGKTINEHLSEDFADVRVFKKNPGGLVEEAEIKPFQQLQIPFRVNAMEVRDMDGDSKAEIIIAGRSRRGESEYSAFAVWSDGNVTYQVNHEQTLPGRFRTVMAVDIDGDGKDELITGGRIDMGERMVADLQVWKLNPRGVTMTARYNWTSEASTRLRALVPAMKKGQFIAAGRTQLQHSEDTPRWHGFIRRFQYQNGSFWPIEVPLLLDKGPETRIRDIKLISTNRYVCAGFIMKTKKKSAGFVLIL